MLWCPKRGEKVRCRLSLKNDGRELGEEEVETEVRAGYMSGMLVPVGVGIAGALFILGALYSIKVMNRRRRNGFKRHKRKQREFNSMQDRVMLLADSSEDEF
ncbi:Armadillo-like helical domain-containing protein 4 [Camelus dromedarius]|uniref:Armadillo-like helical domain-containing protein 4 n=1 Tax=Camelus dromedarius TaxID=9838 RepID=A0A5N4E3L9_CAMDR|nr:Armadillo-like helical domain-containing protein 4 [Camelus dromedarius]